MLASLKSAVGKKFRGKIIVSFESRDSAVLTFDDGPDPYYTPQVLEVLQKHGAKATFFALGRQVELYPRIVRQILASGCEIANHSYDHASFSMIPLKDRIKEIQKCQSAIGPSCKWFFRPPFGHASFGTANWASLLGYKTICWSADASDWETDDSAVMLERLKVSVKPGSIVLLHDRMEYAKDERLLPREGLIRALDQFLSTSKLNFKTLSEMFSSSPAVADDWPWDRDFAISGIEARVAEYSGLVRNVP